MLRFKGVQLSSDLTLRTDRDFAKAQSAIDSEVIRRLEDYTPVSMDKGYNKRLKRVIPFVNKGKMSKSHTAERPGVIINTEPKAKREYYNNKGFSGRNRGRYWLDRMKADHKDDILRKAEEKFR